MKKSKHHSVDEQEIMRFNLKRENQKGKTYNAREFKDLLQSMGYSTSGNLIKCMISGDDAPFIRMERGKYCFNPKPLHISRLQKVWDEYAFIGRNRLANQPDKKQLELDTNRAIKLLKDLGYRVLKPITKYEECLAMKYKVPTWALWVIAVIATIVVIGSIVGIVLVNTATTTRAQSTVTLRGTQFTMEGQSKRGQAFDSLTTYTYRDSNDSVYVVHLSRNLKAFIIRYSNKTGKPYRKYLPKVTEQLDKMRK